MSAGMTTVTYNGVTFYNVLTRDFREEAVFDESGTDFLYHKFLIRIVGYITPQSTAAPPNPSSPSMAITSNQSLSALGPSASLNFATVRHAIQTPRMSFVMMMGVNQDGSGGNVAMQCAAPSSAVSSDDDLNNGA